jgi:broad specificity phosphatase PhoE
MPALILLRHAQASYGSHDYDVLSDHGAVQARAAREALRARGLVPERIVSGTLRRQRDTALPWTEGGAALEEDPRWNEYDAADVLGAHGPGAGASLEAPGLESRDFQGVLDDALLAWIAAGDESAADETWPAFRDRVAAALDDAVGALRSGETGLVITSGGVVAACCARLLALPESSFVAFNHVVVNAAVTKVVHGRRGTSLVSFNEHAHLEPEGLVTYR